MIHAPVENYDNLFCLTIKEDRLLIHKDIKELLQKWIEQYPNDKELGKEIRKHYGSTKG